MFALAGQLRPAHFGWRVLCSALRNTHCLSVPHHGPDHVIPTHVQLPVATLHLVATTVRRREVGADAEVAHVEITAHYG